MGLTNYAAAYCTGLLLASRLLNRRGMDKIYGGWEEVTADDYNVDNIDSWVPSLAIWIQDIPKLQLTIKFWGPEGAVDGGLTILHSTKLFSDYTSESKLNII